VGWKGSARFMYFAAFAARFSNCFAFLTFDVRPLFVEEALNVDRSKFQAEAHDS